MAIIFLPILLTCLVRNLKYLAPLSTFANVVMLTGVIITLYFVTQDLPPVTSRDYVANWNTLPLFFGTALFAFEGIGLVSFVTPAVYIILTNFSLYHNTVIIISVNHLLLSLFLQVLPLQREMKDPQHFAKPLGVLNVGMTFVVILFTTVGFLAYLQFGDEIQGSVTLNLDITNVYVLL